MTKYSPILKMMTKSDPERRAKPWSGLLLTRWGKSNVF